MAEQGLQLNIGANVSDLEKGLAQGAKSIQSFDAKAQAAGANIAKGLTKGTNQAAFALSNLGRVASDAPFGFIAIQNNLDPLIQSFGQLSTASGGTGGAIKALASSLAGPAGLALAFSVVSSTITVSIQKYGSLGAALTALVKGNDVLYKQQVALAKIQAEGAKSAGEEVAKLTVLNAVATDTSNALINRKEAAGEMLRVYKEYLPNLSQEAILNNAAADAINKAKDALLNKALAAAAEKKLAEVGGKLLDNQLRQVKAVNDYSGAQAALDDQVQKSVGKELKGREGINYELEAYRTNVIRSKGALVDVGKEAVQLQQEFESLTNIAKGFAKQAGAAFVTDQKGKTEKGSTFLTQYKKDLEQTVSQLEDQKKNFEKNAMGLTDVYRNTLIDLTKTQSKIAALDLIPVDKIKKIRVEGDIFTFIDPAKLAKANEKLKSDLAQIEREFIKARKIEGQIEFVPTITADKNEVRAKWKAIFESIKRTGFEEALQLQGKTIDVKPKVVINPELQGTLNAIEAVKSNLSGLGKKLFDELAKSFGGVGKLSSETVIAIGKISEKAAQAGQAFSQLFTPVVDTFFENIENGRTAFEALGKSIKTFVINAIKELTKLAIIAGGISLASGGKISFGTAFGLVSKGSMFGGGNKAAPNFSGLSGGGIAVTVGGQFNVRGTDLVAVVAQSNQRIGRVG